MKFNLSLSIAASLLASAALALEPADLDGSPVSAEDYAALVA